MSTAELFYKSHFKQLLAALFVIIFVISWQIVLEDTDWLRKNNQGQVLGSFTSKEIPEPAGKIKKANLIYQNRIKKLIHDYLKSRSNFNAPHQGWLLLANKLKYELLAIPVPPDYQNMHLRLVMIVDGEKKALESGTMDAISQANNNWNNFLNQYFWLK